jgi:general secretion pathway protein I
MSRAPQRGFSLLEVLVAFSILSLSLATLFALFGSGVRSTAVARDYQQALVVAESRMAYLQGVTAQQLKMESAQGETPDGYYWKSAVTPLEQEPPVVAGFTLYQLEVQVSWQEGGHARQIDLATLRLEPAT